MSRPAKPSRKPAGAVLPLFVGEPRPVKAPLTLSEPPYDPVQSGAALAVYLTDRGIGRAPLAMRLGVSLERVRALLRGEGDLDAAWQAAEALAREQWAEHSSTVAHVGLCGWCGQVHPLMTCLHRG